MIFNPAARVRILSGDQYTIRLQSLHRVYPSLHPSGVVHWVPEQLNIKALTRVYLQTDWWLQPRAVFGHTFSGIIWHMPLKLSQFNCMTPSKDSAKDSSILYTYCFYYTIQYRVVHGSLFLDPTRPDPRKRWPDPTRDCRQKVWPDPTRPAARPFHNMYSLHLNNHIY